MTIKTPVVLDGDFHKPLKNGDAIPGSAVQISNQPDNALSLAPDGGMYVNRAQGVTYRSGNSAGGVPIRALRRAFNAWPNVVGDLFEHLPDGGVTDLKGGAVLLPVGGRYSVNVRAAFGLLLWNSASSETPAIAGDQMAVLLGAWDTFTGLFDSVSQPVDGSVLPTPGSARHDVVVDFTTTLSVPSSARAPHAIAPLLYLDLTAPNVASCNLQGLYTTNVYSIGVNGNVTGAKTWQVEMTVTQL